MNKEEIKKLDNKNLVGQLISHAHTFGDMVKNTQDFADEILCRLEPLVSLRGAGKFKTKYKYIEFIKAENDLKIWNIWNHRYNQYLGQLEYNNKWKEWEFFPEMETGWTQVCWRDIDHFVEQLKATKSS